MRSVCHAEASLSQSSRIPSTPRRHRRVSAAIKGSERGGGGKTLSMENIQSINAAYATSGPVYLSDYEVLSSSAYPNGTMTLGRTYRGRPTGPKSNLNLSSSLGYLQLDSVAYGDSPLLRQAAQDVPKGERSSLIGQLSDLQREQEFDSELSSSSNCFKTYWSPEFKKKRALRKDEKAKSAMLKKQMKEENQHLQMHTEEFCSQSELVQQNCAGSLGSLCDPFPYLELTEDDFHHLQADHDRQNKEIYLLRKALKDMEQHNECQKQTLSVRDESIRQLLEMHQDKGFVRSELPDKEGLRVSCEAVEKMGHLRANLEQKQKENMHPREELHRRNPLIDPTKNKALQTVIDMKDTKITTLERSIRDLEDEIQMLKTSSLSSVDDRDERLKQIDIYKNHSKFMKGKIDHLKHEVVKKESEMLALHTQLETLTNQNSDYKQHVEVLKESLTAKEQRANVLQTEVDALRLRLEEKESFLNKKSKQLQDILEEKGTLSGEIRDLKDMLEVKERKITVLQRKIENLQDQLKDKDKQLDCLRDRVKSLQTDSSNTDTALATLEEALSEKERVIEHLKEQKGREEQEKQGETEAYRKEIKELKDKIFSLQAQLSKNEALETEKASQRNPELSDRLTSLEKEVALYKEETGRSKAEVDRLMGVLKDLETERIEREKKISDLERQAKQQNTNLADAKPAQLEEKRSPDSTSQDSARETVEKIKELEKALRESMNTSAHREALWAQEEQSHALAQRQLEELMAALEKTRQELDMTRQRLTTTQNSLAERESNLSSMKQERQKQLEEILEMKQQALLAAISEKDANIALLELSAHKKKTSQEEVVSLKREKDKLMYQLKQQMQSRMKLIAENYEDGHHRPHHIHHPHHAHHRGPSRGPPSHSNHQPQLEQDDEEGIWA